MGAAFELLQADDGSKLQSMIGAVIYIRVSTKEQTENLSLPTQLRACEEYCHRQGYEVLERFKEEGESAKTADRPELQRLLKYCRTHKGRVHFVVVFNLTRFAREKYDHFALRSHLKSLGISLRSATEPIDDTATGKLMEGVLASFAQFDNDVRSDRKGRNEGGARDRTMDLPRADRLHQRSEVMRKEPHSRPGQSSGRKADLRGLRHGSVHQTGTAGADHPARCQDTKRTAAQLAGIRHDARKPPLHRHC